MSVRVYHIDVKLYATAYIKASSVEEALAAAKALQGKGPSLQDSDGDVPISDLMFDDPLLPDVSLSPHMTIHGPDEGDEPELMDEYEDNERTDAEDHREECQNDENAAARESDE